MPSSAKPIAVDILVTRETTPSGLYGLHDTLAGVGVNWEDVVAGVPGTPKFKVRKVAAKKELLHCAAGYVVAPDAAFDETDSADIVVVSGVLASTRERYTCEDRSAFEWLRGMHSRGSRLASSCAGAVVLAEAGLLDDQEATTHWAYGDVFRSFYPGVKLRLDKNLCYSAPDHGTVTSGGSTAWTELVLFLIAQYAGLKYARHTAKFWLLGDSGGVQAPYFAMTTGIPHDDAIIHESQHWVGDHYSSRNPVAQMTQLSGLPPTTFARRFKRATGYSPKDYVLAVRVQKAKHTLETSDETVEDIGRQVGYEDPVSFRRIFKRITGLTPGGYRRLFGLKRFDRYLTCSD